MMANEGSYHEEHVVLDIDGIVDDVSAAIADGAKFMGEEQVPLSLSNIAAGGVVAEGGVSDLVAYMAADAVTPIVIYAVLNKLLRDEQQAFAKSAEIIPQHKTLSPARCVNCTLGTNVRLTNDSLDTVCDALASDLGAMLYDRIMSLFPELTDMTATYTDYKCEPVDEAELVSELIETECLELLRSIIEDCLYSTTVLPPTYSVEEFEDMNSDFIK